MSTKYNRNSTLFVFATFCFTLTFFSTIVFGSLSIKEQQDHHGWTNANCTIECRGAFAINGEYVAFWYVDLQEFQGAIIESYLTRKEAQDAIASSPSEKVQPCLYKENGLRIIWKLPGESYETHRYVAIGTFLGCIFSAIWMIYFMRQPW